MQHQDGKCHQARKCNMKKENFIKIENCSSMCSLSAKKNRKGQNTEVMEFNSKQLIHYLKVKLQHWNG